MGVLPEEHKKHLKESFEKNVRYEVSIILSTRETEYDLLTPPLKEQSLQNAMILKGLNA